MKPAMDDMERRDRDLEGLAALPARDAPPDVAARVHRQALARLAHERAYQGRPYLGALLDGWSRVGVPVALASVVGVYLTWAFQLAGALYR
jgi:anti-sigma-K factor RskA